MTLASHLQYAEIPLRIGHGGIRHTARARAHLQVAQDFITSLSSGCIYIYCIYA